MGLKTWAPVLTYTIHLFSIFPMNAPPLSVQRARTLLKPSRVGGLWDLTRIEGRVVEVSEAGCFGALSALCPLLTQVQARGESIAWVETGSSVFFPPDLAFRGLDVRAINVVAVPEARGGLRAIDVLLRSGAFGLIVADWTGGAVDEAILGRLARVAENAVTAVVFLTRKRPEDPSVGTQVSLRAVVSITSEGETQWQVVKDKLSGPPSKQGVTFHGPFGLY